MGNDGVDFIDLLGLWFPTNPGDMRALESQAWQQHSQRQIRDRQSSGPSGAGSWNLDANILRYVSLNYSSVHGLTEVTIPLREISIPPSRRQLGGGVSVQSKLSVSGKYYKCCNTEGEVKNALSLEGRVSVDLRWVYSTNIVNAMRRPDEPAPWSADQQKRTTGSRQGSGAARRENNRQVSQYEQLMSQCNSTEQQLRRRVQSSEMNSGIGAKPLSACPEAALTYNLNLNVSGFVGAVGGVRVLPSSIGSCRSCQGCRWDFEGLNIRGTLSSEIGAYIQFQGSAALSLKHVF